MIVAKKYIFEYIKVYYNRILLHSAPSDKSPVAVEAEKEAWLLFVFMQQDQWSVR